MEPTLSTPVEFARRWQAGFVVIALVMIGAGMGFYSRLAGRVRTEQHGIIAAMSELKVKQVQSWRRERVKDVRRAAKGPLVRRRTAELLAGQPGIQARADLLEQLRLNRMEGLYGSTALLTPAGKLLLSTEADPEPEHPASVANAARAATTGEPVFSEFFAHSDGIVHLDVAAGVRDERGEVLAVLILRINVDNDLFPMIQQWPIPNLTAETVLVLRAADEARVPHVLRHADRREPRWHQPLSRTEYPAVQAVLGRTGYFEGKDYRGIPVLADLRSIPDSPWFMVSKIDQDEALAHLRSETGFIAAMTAASVLLAAVFFAYSFRQRQARDFRQLYELEQGKLQVERSLRQSEERLNFAAAAGNQGLYDLDVETGEGSVNAEYATMLGHDPETFRESHHAWLERMHPEDRWAASTAYQEYLAGVREEYRIEFRQRTKAGDWMWILSQGKIVERTPEGRPLRMLGARTDITEIKQGQRALAEARERLDLALQGSSDGIWDWDLVRGVGHASDRWWEMLGYAPGEIQMTPSLWTEWIHPEDHERVTEHIRIHLEKRETYAVEFRMRRKGGDYRWFLARGQAVWNGEGQATRMAGSTTDITERRQREADLRESEQRFRDLVDSTDGIVWEADAATFEFQSVSANAERMLGFPVKAWLQPGFWASRIHPEDREWALAYCAACTDRGEDHDFEYRFLAQDGRVVWLRDIVKVIEEEGGQRWLRGLMVDISRQKQVEDALRSREQEFRDLLWNLPAGVMVYGPEAEVLDCNPLAEKLLGLNLDQVKHLKPGDFPWSHRIREDGSPVPLAEYPVFQVLDTGEPVRGKVMGFLLAGKSTPLWGLIHAFPIRDSLGQLRRIIVIFVDISELKEAEAHQRQLERQLQHSQKMESLGLLASGVAHDMNNVLGAILGLATAHRELQGEGTSAFRVFDTIVKASTRGANLVKGLLGFSRQGLAEEVELDVNGLVREEVHLLERTTLNRVRLDMDLARGLPPIRGDAGALSHVLMNLCVNAVDATPDNGLLSLRTRLAGSHVEIDVEDTGCGMPHGILERAMEPFFTTKPQGKGTGLGLSIVFNTVKAHGGTTEIFSTPGQGTRVRLRFPALVLAPQEAAAMAGAPSESTSPSRRTAMHVLLVDDDELVSTSVQEMIQLLGFTVSTAFTGEDALARLEGGLRPDVVILDLNMPGLGGAGTLPLLRAMRPALPVLLATGRAEQVALDLVQAHEGVTLMSKPFSMVELRNHLRALAPADSA